MRVWAIAFLISMSALNFALCFVGGFHPANVVNLGAGTFIAVLALLMWSDTI